MSISNWSNLIFQVRSTINFNQSETELNTLFLKLTEYPWIKYVSKTDNIQIQTPTKLTYHQKMQHPYAHYAHERPGW